VSVPVSFPVRSVSGMSPMLTSEVISSPREHPASCHDFADSGMSPGISRQVRHFDAPVFTPGR
jgi:hypothetical protein